jgi:hypothetical protein
MPLEAGFTARGWAKKMGARVAAPKRRDGVFPQADPENCQRQASTKCLQKKGFGSFSSSVATEKG